MIDYKQLEQARKDVGIKKQAIAAATKIPARRVGEILACVSDPRISELEAICEVIGCVLVLSTEQPTDTIPIPKGAFKQLIEALDNQGCIVLK